MFRSSASLMAEDVTVRCRVRKLSSNAVNGDGSIDITNSSLRSNKDVDTIHNSTTVTVEMTCTMRNWDSSHQRSTSHPLQSSSRNSMLQNAFSLSNPNLLMETNATNEASFRVFRSDSAIDIRESSKLHQSGPELLFTPTQYDVSPSKSTRVHVSRRISPVSLQQPYSIPVNEILLVTYDIANSSESEMTSHTKLHITTLSLGHYDMDCITSNGHDIVLAFLQSSLPQERIVRDENKSQLKSKNTPSPHKSTNRSIHKSKRKSTNTRSDHDGDELPSVNSTNSSVASSCFDIDALQAKHLAGRAEAETWYEKIQRRYGHVVSNILEQFDTCCNNTATATTTHSNNNNKNKGNNNTSETTTIQQRPASSDVSTPTRPTSSISSPNRCNMSNGITGCLYGELEIDDNATECSIRNSSSPLVRSHRQQNATVTSKSSPLPPKHKNINTGSSSSSSSSSSSPQRYQNNNQQHPNPHQLSHPQIRIAHMPSGLSVEPEPFDTESVR